MCPFLFGEGHPGKKCTGRDHEGILYPRGKCLEVCPQNAKTFVSDLEQVKSYIRSGQKVVVSIAPSYLGIMVIKMPGQVVDGLMRLGFTAVRETAEGAALSRRNMRGFLKRGRWTM